MCCVLRKWKVEGELPRRGIKINPVTGHVRDAVLKAKSAVRVLFQLEKEKKMGF